MSETLNSTLTLEFKDDIVTRFVNTYAALPSGTLGIVITKSLGGGNFEPLSPTTQILTSDLGLAQSQPLNTASVVIERTNGIPIEIQAGDNVGQIAFVNSAAGNAPYSIWTLNEPIQFPNGGNLIIEKLEFVLGDPS